jgi:hypothetical protein
VIKVIHHLPGFASSLAARVLNDGTDSDGDADTPVVVFARCNAGAVALALRVPLALKLPLILLLAADPALLTTPPPPPLPPLCVRAPPYLGAVVGAIRCDRDAALGEFVRECDGDKAVTVIDLPW